MLRDDLLKQANMIDIESILNYYSISEADSYKRYRCIDPGHIDNKPSASIDRSKNRLKCFSCNKIFSPIDIVSLMEPNDNLRECAKRVLEISNISFVPQAKNTCIEVKGGVIKKDEKRKLTIQDRKNMLIKANSSILEDYLVSRAINPKIVLPILDKNNVTYGVDRLKQPTFIFEKYGVCIYRFVKENENRVTGINAPISLLSDSSDKNWWIVEGIFDALTLLNLKKNVICLNSAKNVISFTEKIVSSKEKMRKFSYVIAVDNDDVGDVAKVKLEEFFRANGIKYENFDRLYQSEYKDINDMRKDCRL